MSEANEMPYRIAWLNARPYCWAASIDGGKTYEKLEADNDDASFEAIDEASQEYGIDPIKWELMDDPIDSLRP